MSTATKACVGKLLVEVISAQGLPAVDGSSSDPFVRVLGADGLELCATGAFGCQGDPMDWQCNRTEPKEKNLNPTWNYQTELQVATKEGNVLFLIKDYNVLTKNKYMCEAKVTMRAVLDGKLSAITELPCHSAEKGGAPAGKLHVKVVFVETAEQTTGQADPVEAVLLEEPGSYNFRTFTSSAATNVFLDIKAANEACRAWLNKVRDHIELIKIDNETLSIPAAAVGGRSSDMAYVCVWYRRTQVRGLGVGHVDPTLLAMKLSP